MGFPLDSCGISVGFPWNFYWISMISLRYYYWIMGFLWHSYGTSMMFLWYFYEITMWFLKGCYGNSMVFLWDFHWIPMGFLWYSYDVSMGFLWDSYGFLWHSYGSSMMFLWYFHGITMGFLRDLYGISLWFLCYFHVISMIFLWDFNSMDSQSVGWSWQSLNLLFVSSTIIPADFNSMDSQSVGWSWQSLNLLFVSSTIIPARLAHGWSYSPTESDFHFPSLGCLVSTDAGSIVRDKQLYRHSQSLISVDTVGALQKRFVVTYWSTLHRELPSVGEGPSPPPEDHRSTFIRHRVDEIWPAGQKMIGCFASTLKQNRSTDVAQKKRNKCSTTQQLERSPKNHQLHGFEVYRKHTDHGAS